MPQLYESYNDVFSLLPVKLYKHDLIGNYIHADLHWHRSLEITITLTGSIRFNTGSNNFDFGESDWTIVNSCELHSGRYISSSDHFTGISLIISLPFIEKWIGKNLFFINPENPELTKKIKKIALELYYIDTADIDYNYLLMCKLYEIVGYITKYCVQSNTIYSAPHNQDNKDVVTFAEYIEQHYQEDLSLNSVAEHFKYSPSYFSRLFKESLGVNFLSYLNFVRVSHAAQQISNGCDNLSACAYDNGFPNMKSFINAFKKLYGCTPSVFQTSFLAGEHQKL